MKHLDIAYYLELQKRLKEILLFVSCHEENFDTYSVKIENLFISTSAFLDSLCQSFIISESKKGYNFTNAKNISKLTRKLGGQDFFNMNDYQQLLEKDFDLSKKEINVNVYSDNLFINPDYLDPQNVGYRITPFGNWSKGSLDWWKSYTKLKHNRLANIKEASLKNTLNALGAAFIILTIKNQEDFKEGVVNKEVYEVFFPLYWSFKARILTGNPVWE